MWVLGKGRGKKKIEAVSVIVVLSRFLRLTVARLLEI